MLRSLRILATTLALAVVAPVALHAQQDTSKTAGQVVQNDVHRAAKQTNKQAQRTGKSLARVVSRKARHGDYTTNVSGPSLKTSKPLTPKQVGKNVENDVHRAGKQTVAQAHRTGKSLEKIVSRKARKDSTKK